MGFWKIPQDAKWDELSENNRQHLIHRALSDKETGLYPVKSNEYILYGGEQALLFRPTRIVYKVVMFLYEGLLKVL